MAEAFPVLRREILRRGMPHENVDKLRRMYELAARGDRNGVAAFFHPDIELFPASQGLPHQGIESVRAWMEPDALVDQTWEALDFTVAGDKVLVKQRIRARGASSGIEVAANAWGVFTFGEDGLVTRIQGYLEDEEAEARDAAGLPV